MFKKISSSIRKLTNLAFASTMKTMSFGTIATLFMIVGLVFVIMAPQFFKSLYFQYHANSVLYLKICSKEGCGHGTAFHVKNSKGERYLLTNAHNCVNPDNPKIKYSFTAISIDGGHYPTKIVKSSKNRDLCILEPVGNFKTFNLNDQLTYEVPVYVIGYPRSYPMTLTKGDIIGFVTRYNNVEGMSSKRCKKSGGEHRKIVQKFNFYGQEITVIKQWCQYKYSSIQTTIPIRRGNSGSPLIDIMGRAVGIIYAADEGWWGIAVPASDIIKFIEE